MTNKDAIKIIEKLQYKQQVSDKELWEATLHAMAAMDKENPHEFYFPDHRYCGVCRKQMDYIVDQEGRTFKYCPICGNKFAHGNDDEFKKFPYLENHIGDM